MIIKVYILKEKDFKDLEIILKEEFNTVKQSPYSLSIYNSLDIGWNYKPEGSYRVSNHWNFKGHCRTMDEVSNLKLSIGVYLGGIYKIIKSYEYDEYLDNDYKYGGYYIDGYSIKYGEFEIKIEDINNKIKVKKDLGYICCYKISKREVDVKHKYLILEGNRLSLCNADLEEFNKGYSGSFKGIISKIVSSQDSNEGKLGRILRIAKNNPNIAIFKEYKNGKDN